MLAALLEMLQSVQWLALSEEGAIGTVLHWECHLTDLSGTTVDNTTFVSTEADVILWGTAPLREPQTDGIPMPL